MNKKKIMAMTIMSLLIVGATAVTAFAAMPNGTVVIGDKGYDLNYASDPVNTDLINASVVAANDKICVKSFDGSWIENTSGKFITDLSVIQAVTYTDGKNTMIYTFKDDLALNNVNSSSGLVTEVNLVTPGALSFVSIGETLCNVGTVTLKATDSDAIITGIKLARNGLSEDSFIDNITIWDGNTRVNRPSIFLNGVADITFANSVNIPKGSTKTLSIKVNISTKTVVGAQFILSVDDKASIKTTANVNGIFPVASGIITAKAAPKLPQ